jgi:hypothetical protein
MTDPLVMAIEKALRADSSWLTHWGVLTQEAAEIAARSVRAFLAEVSPQEIEAATDAVDRDYMLFRDPRYGTALVRREIQEIVTAALAASRSVLLGSQSRNGTPMGPSSRSGKVHGSPGVIGDVWT